MVLGKFDFSLRVVQHVKINDFEEQSVLDEGNTTKFAMPIVKRRKFYKMNTSYIYVYI